MDELEIITTSDGSHTLRNKHLNETYHSTHGAMQESMHVFIRNGLEYFHGKNPAENISILEVGFGTGLNALLAFQYSLRTHIAIRYTTLEPFPLARNVWSKLNYRAADPEHFDLLHEGEWNREIQLSTGFRITKLQVALEEANFVGMFDVVFFDAFAPSKQPELWGYDILKGIAARLNTGGVFVTYSAKGQLQRDLKALNLDVETLPGAPGKMHMVRATMRPSSE